MTHIRLIILFLMIALLIPAYPSFHVARAQTIKYDWTGFSMKNGTRYDLPGGFQMESTIEKQGGFPTGVATRILKNGRVCLNYQLTLIEGYNTRSEIPIKENCTSGRVLYKVLIKGDMTDTNNGIIYFDIKDSILPPISNLTMKINFPRTKEFNEPYAQFQVPVIIKNLGPWDINWVRIDSNWFKQEGEGSINLTGIVPVEGTNKGSTEANITLNGLHVEESQQVTFTFHAGPGEGKYGSYTIGFTVTYPVMFSYVNTTTRGLGVNAYQVKIYEYNPNATESLRGSINVVFGLKYKGHRGKPKMDIYMKTPKGDLEVNPGTPITFRFYAQNIGNDDAYNVTINAKVEPNLPIDITEPSSIAGHTFPIVVLSDVPHKAMTQDIAFRIVIPSDAEGMTYHVNISVGYFNIEGAYNETFRLFTISVKKFGTSKLYITKSISSTTIPVNGTVEVNVIVGNNGTAAATNVVVEDSYPSDIFKLVSGKTKVSASKLDPGSMLSLSYKLKAVREGVTNFGPAKVTYIDPKEGQKVLLSTQKSPVVITIVEPKLSVKVEDIPQNVTVVNSLVGFSIYMINRGSGDAKDLTLDMELSPGFYMVSPPAIKKGEGVSCDQPVWEPKENEISVKMVCDTIKPEGFVKLILTLKTQTTGKQWIRVKDIYYKSPDGLTTLEVPTSSYRYETVVVTPLELRLFYLAIFTFSVLIVAAFVIGVTRGFRVSVGRRRPRTRFGALES